MVQVFGTRGQTWSWQGVETHKSRDHKVSNGRYKLWESWRGGGSRTKKNEKQRERWWKSTKFVILPPFRDPALNNIQKLVSVFEQIADMPQNRGCLSWDGVKGSEKRDARKAWEREEGERGTQRWTGVFEIVKRNVREAEERWDPWETGLYKKQYKWPFGQIDRNNI